MSDSDPSDRPPLVFFLAAAGALLALVLLLPQLITGDPVMGNEAAAVGQLRAIHTAQELFRDADWEHDGKNDYGTLAELVRPSSRGTLLDRRLAEGAWHGYVFQVFASRAGGEERWFATARPSVPGTGARFFCTSQAGVVYYRLDRPFSMDPACAPPADAIRVGS